MAATVSRPASFVVTVPLPKMSTCFKGLSLQVQQRPAISGPLSTSSQGSQLPIVSQQKHYKAKTHQASAKRFRVTGSGKIMCRRAGKQHLLWKKNTKRRKRLSKMALVEKCDYQNITRALPYLKVSKS
ncbi:hypothetical protein GOP47_0003626 [Adiantum capillus-veneris]|uniref:50S ribosomal protein L35 n=1 Tax=Adiantum capillus-veneris TaxID=13818 RepID=A0A9D4V6A8_ADICA|nr:hypothetical protein GOP47_0003626 [Adiantum capillus-veneris]